MLWPGTYSRAALTRTLCAGMGILTAWCSEPPILYRLKRFSYTVSWTLAGLRQSGPPGSLTWCEALHLIRLPSRGYRDM